MPAPPWKTPTGADAVVASWLASGSVRPCMTADHTLPTRLPRFGELPPGLDRGLVQALQGRGVTRLYAHQAVAIGAARGGRHVVIATPTASGKSLCFHLPVLDTLRRDPSATAIFLYPTKALSRDQESSLRELIRDADLGLPAIVYDGDTPGDARRAARERSPIVMTNPDMLHAGILPHHAHWARTFQGLKYVVIDELHTYRGVFGSHVANVLARLRRIAAFHGANPTFIAATATIGNPREHAARLFGVSEDAIELVSDSGAPTPERRVFVYNPPVVNAELGIRASYLKSAVRLASDLVRAKVPTIMFGESRNAVEIMLKYLRESVGRSPEGKTLGNLDEAIMAYRGGYLPETRRRVERGLRDGSILCVVATNALELGIDIGDLDAVVCAGYPGSVAGTWQRFGRAGRRGKTTLLLLVTSSRPLDQYLTRHPELLLESGVEHARIDPSNTEILVQHLKCAAFELPFVAGEAYGGLPQAETVEALRFLEGHGVVHESGGRFHWSSDAYPASQVSLRSVGWDNTVIIEVGEGRVLGELDWRATPTMLHEQAIYQHDGEQFQVERLDNENHKAYVRKVAPDYFTTAMTNRKVTILEVAREAPLGRALACFGEVSLVEHVTGYKKIKFFTHENTGYGDVRLPDIQMHTTAFWLTVPEPICLELGLGRAAAIDGLRGLGRALETLATLHLYCDPRDIGQALETGSEAALERLAEGERFDPTLFLFDNVPGGVGLAERIFEEAPELLARARQLIGGCGCDEGCPACVGATVEGLGGLRKRAAILLGERLMHG